LCTYRQLSAIADTLIEEVGRRFTGDFWTPKLWADKAHELISAELGDDWKDNYLVWDAAAGTKNLTRDYCFGRHCGLDPQSPKTGNLFCSTLHEEEIAISDMYNPEANTFQYDFLNDDVWLPAGQRTITDSLKMPVELYKTLTDKRPFVFFMNPPYGQATTQLGEHKTGAVSTQIGALMNL
jgi:hypothetical protein